METEVTLNIVDDKEYPFILDFISDDEKLELSTEEKTRWVVLHPMCFPNPLNDYEFYMFSKYMYNELVSIYDSEKLAISAKVRTFLSKIVFKRYMLQKSSFFKKHLEKTFFKQLEAELDKSLLITNLKSQFKKEGHTYVRVSMTELALSPDTRDILMSYFKKFLDQLKACTELNPKKLKKQYYTKNFETYMSLLGNFKDSEPDLYKVLESALYLSIDFFKDYFCSSFENFLSTILHLKAIDYAKLNKYARIFFIKQTNSYDNEYFAVNFKLINMWFRQYKNETQFIESIVKKIKPSTLTYDDFSYVVNLDYMQKILKTALKKHKKGVNILLYGKPGTGKTELAKLLIQNCTEEGYIVTDDQSDDTIMKAIPTNSRNTNFGTLQFMLKDNKNSIILYDEAEDYFRVKDDDFLMKFSVNKQLEENTVPVIWTTNSTAIDKAFLRRFTYACEMNDIPIKQYKNIIKNQLDKYNIKDDGQLLDVCYKNKLSVGVIKTALDNSKLVKTTDLKTIYDNLVEAAKLVSFKHSGYSPYFKKDRVEFDPRLLNTSDDLEEFSNKIVENGRLDFSLLLYGVSGSGKSYYATYLANKLGLDVLKKKASDLESCWVGETEKNIAELFNEARLSKALIIIDEGDYFISDRSKHVRSWETSRTEEMLVQIEAHPYPVIFTTNLMDNVDKAAMRRFTYKTQFDYLTPDQVKIAWNDYFPNARLPEEIHLSKICPGDFATVLKRAEFEGYTSDTKKIYESLQMEQKLKKDENSNAIKL